MANVSRIRSFSLFRRTMWYGNEVNTSAFIFLIFRFFFSFILELGSIDLRFIESHCVEKNANSIASIYNGRAKDWGNQARARDTKQLCFYFSSLELERRSNWRSWKALIFNVRHEQSNWELYRSRCFFSMGFERAEVGSMRFNGQTETVQTFRQALSRRRWRVAVTAKALHTFFHSPRTCQLRASANVT